MTISNKTRKLLWGKSGNQCAICRCQLSLNNTPSDPHSVIGDECHIISGKFEGPRFDQMYPREKLDEYENIILLCKIHHKAIDDQPIYYSIEKLHEIKKLHERYIAESLTSFNNIKNYKEQHLTRIDTGKELLSIASGTYALAFDNDKLQTESEVKLVSGLLQNIQDWTDIGETEASARVVEEFNFTKLIEELKNAGFVLYGARIRRKVSLSGQVVDWPTATFRIFRNTNPWILK